MIRAELVWDLGLPPSIDGPYDHVFEIKPPIVFSKGNADQMAQALSGMGTSGTIADARRDVG